jgi:hypothetical protein
MARRFGFDVALLSVDGFRRWNRCGSLRLSSSSAIEQPVRRTRSVAHLRRGEVRPPSRRVTSCAAVTHAPWRGFPIPPASLEASGSRPCSAWLPAGRARLPRCKTQYKCGNSRLWNNHPLGKPGYDQRILLACTSHCFRWSEKAAETSLSSGTQMHYSAADGSTKLPAIRAMEWPRPEALGRAGTTGAEVE